MKLKFIALLLLASGFLHAQDFFRYTISKPYCILNFMETATGSPGTSSTLRKFIDEKTGTDANFNTLCGEFAKITLHYNISRNGFPESRNQNGSTYNLLAMNAVNAKDLADFKIKCIGLLPLNDNQKLYALLSEAEKIYDRIIWKEYEAKIKSQLRQLSKLTAFNKEVFSAFAGFYQTSWTNDIPFQVAIYPIPGKSGNTTATPHVNSLCVGVLTDETDYVSRNGVVLHEMCHILFNEQSAEVQNKIELYFTQSPSSYARIAYSFLDEALATALGNGWTFKKSTGKEDDASWYNNTTIDGFAKALYPAVNQYLEAKKPIDKEFIDNAIIAFAAKFPKSLYDYDISLNGLVLYTEFEDNTLIKADLRKQFRVASLSISSPVLHTYSLESMNESRLSQMFIINQNHQEIANKLKEIFPEISSFNYAGKTENLSFTDKKGRTVIMLFLTDMSQLKLQLQKMKEIQYFDPNSLIQKQ